jgi:uncharacterized protein (TIGR02996 family)
MPERDSFLHMILENPDEDAPRLVYADWLEEQGDPLAEFIRLQCELVITQDEQQELTNQLFAVPHFPSRKEQDFLRQGQCLDLHADEWLQPLARPWIRPDGDLITVRQSRHDDTLVELRRGFVESVVMGTEQGRKSLTALLQTQPLASIQLLLDFGRHVALPLVRPSTIEPLPSVLVQIQKMNRMPADASWFTQSHIDLGASEGKIRAWRKEYSTRDDLVRDMPGDLWQWLRENCG